MALAAFAALQLAACGAGAGAARSAAGHDPGASRGSPDSRAAVPSRLQVLRSGGADEGFARALAVRQFEFPRDHGPHPAYRHEWWYFTGHLRAADGERFGFEVTFFRVALAPPRAAAAPATSEASSSGEPASRWRARQIYVAHFAITDIDHRTFHSTQRFARDALGIAGAQAAPFRVWLGSWSVAQARDAASVNDASAAGDWIVRAADRIYGLELQLHPLSPPVLNGDRGLSIKSNEPGAASYYYSIPRLAARGQLTRCGRDPGDSSVRESGVGESGACEPRAGASRALEVSGTAWLDREWGSGALGAHQQGWDWFGLQLADGSALIFYALRDDGGARDPHSAGTWIGPDGTVRPLASAEVRIDTLDHWTSPRGTRYPSRWRVRIASLGLDVTATPALADQELDTTPRYWEGDVDISGTRAGRSVSGQGYVELAGYAGR